MLTPIDIWIEYQLLVDLRNYFPLVEDLSIDWSEIMTEGNVTHVGREYLENLSGLIVKDSSGQKVAEGWMNFIDMPHVPPIVFWEELRIVDGEESRTVAQLRRIPEHVWMILPAAFKYELKTMADRGVGEFRDDPKIREWMSAV